MLLTKILISLQLLHYYSVLTHPLLSSTSFVKRSYQSLNNIHNSEFSKALGEGENLKNSDQGRQEISQEKAVIFNQDVEMNKGKSDYICTSFTLSLIK